MPGYQFICAHRVTSTRAGKPVPVARVGRPRRTWGKRRIAVWIDAALLGSAQSADGLRWRSLDQQEAGSRVRTRLCPGIGQQVAEVSSASINSAFLRRESARRSGAVDSGRLLVVAAFFGLFLDMAARPCEK
jgi:hypothetical protein